jgi:5-methyltetrahydrofolate--homocysteine methyltransferase
MPNAGLPCSIDGCTTYPFGPETFARKVETLARNYGISIVGGCCGSGPGHIEALAQRLMDRPIPRQRPKPRPALASLYRAKPISTGFFKVGERANSAGSAAFAALLDAEDFEGMADKALLQEKTGAAAIDIHLSRAGRDEASDLERLVRLLSSRSNAALSLDSSDPAVLARALPYVGGRPLLNSTSLEDIDKARRVFELAFEFGAAVVCLALDGAGPAASVQDKVGICRKLYDMATREYGLSPDSLLFDPLTFTIAAGGDPATTIQAIGAVKTACPGSLSVLGVGNISYGLPRQVRSAVTAIFLEKAMQAGLDAAILDTGGVPDLGTIDPDLKRAALQALRFEKTDQAPEDAADALEGLLEWAAAHSKSPPVPAPPTRQHTDEGGPGSVGTALAAALARGDARSAEKEALLFLETEEPATLMALVTESMAESGRLWNEGILSLPLVLRSAEAAKRALAPLADSDKKEAKGTIIMATVKGDLHDIGKNIVAAILACSGWNIVDLGTDVPTSQIVEAARQKSVVAVGLSGLLTRSLAEMKKTCTALNQEGIACLVLCGGAAVDPRYVERELEPQHPGLVKTCKDAFEAARVLAELVLKENKSEAKGKTPAHPAPPFLSEQAAPKGSAISPPSKQAYRPLLTGAQAPRSLEFSRLVKALNERWLFSTLWAYRGEELASSKGELRRLLAEVEPILCPAMVYGHFPCRRLSPDLLLIGEPNKSTELLFPRETGGHRRSLSDYFCAEGDMMPIFAVTIGRELSDQAIRLKEEGRYEEYWKLHGLGSALAEAAARLAHERIEDEIRAGGGPGKARRYSFGFPACPGTEYQRVILDLLGAERINLDVTAGHQLVPEHSITAFLVPREDAVYFDA